MDRKVKIQKFEFEFQKILKHILYIILRLSNQAGCREILSENSRNERQRKGVKNRWRIQNPKNSRKFPEGSQKAKWR